ncbi:MAG TPA: hypothetical protein VN578_20845 [Candidatus Binatia bacterium]|jgi:hypothetical protein|nr:hypothetical protein [Candidatus Binatia bacterium]
MKSDIEKFFSVLFQLLGEFREHVGALAWIALGVVLALCITFSILALRWIRRGGLASGFSHRFFAERRETERWLKRR